MSQPVALGMRRRLPRQCTHRRREPGQQHLQCYLLSVRVEATVHQLLLAWDADQESRPLRRSVHPLT